MNQISRNWKNFLNESQKQQINEVTVADFMNAMADKKVGSEGAAWKKYAPAILAAITGALAGGATGLNPAAAAAVGFGTEQAVKKALDKYGEKTIQQAMNSLANNKDAIAGWLIGAAVKNQIPDGQRKGLDYYYDLDDEFENLVQGMDSDLAKQFLGYLGKEYEVAINNMANANPADDIKKYLPLDASGHFIKFLQDKGESNIGLRVGRSGRQKKQSSMRRKQVAKAKAAAKSKKEPTGLTKQLSKSSSAGVSSSEKADLASAFASQEPKTKKVDSKQKEQEIEQLKMALADPKSRIKAKQGLIDLGVSAADIKSAQSAADSRYLSDMAARRRAEREKSNAEREREKEQRKLYQFDIETGEEIVRDASGEEIGLKDPKTGKVRPSPYSSKSGGRARFQEVVSYDSFMKSMKIPKKASDELGLDETEEPLRGAPIRNRRTQMIDMLDFGEVEDVLSYLNSGGDRFLRSDLDHPLRRLAPSEQRQLGLFVQELEDQVDSERGRMSPEVQKRIDKKLEDFKRILAHADTVNELPPAPPGDRDVTMDLREAQRLLREVYQILEEGMGLHK